MCKILTNAFSSQVPFALKEKGGGSKHPVRILSRGKFQECFHFVQAKLQIKLTTGREKLKPNRSNAKNASPLFAKDQKKVLKAANRAVSRPQVPVTPKCSDKAGSASGGRQTWGHSPPHGTAARAKSTISGKRHFSAEFCAKHITPLLAPQQL